MSEQHETFIAHLVELRDRLLRALIAVAVVFVCLMPWAGEIYDLLARPMMNTLPAGTNMIATGVVTPFFVPVKVTMLVAFVLALPVVPPCAVQMSAERFVLHREPQSRSVAQVRAGFAVQVPVTRSQVSVGKRQVTNPGLPQVERAAQRFTFPLQLVGMTSGSAESALTTWATQLT